MGLSIKNDETEQLVRTLAKRRGVGYTVAIHQAVRNELRRDEMSGDCEWQRRLADIALIQKRSKALPIIDPRTDDEILGYGDDGLPG